MSVRGVEATPTTGQPPGLGTPSLAAKDPTRLFYRIVGPCGRKEFVVHNNSLNNLKRGLVERVFMVERNGSLALTPRPSSGMIARCLSPIHKELQKFLPTTAPLTRETFVNSYVGRKGAMYANALESLKAEPLTVRDSRTSSFLKAEKVPNKAPRIIQPRNTRFHVELGVFIKPIEHRIYHALDLLNEEQVVAKCLNLSQRGRLIAEKWNSYMTPVAIGLDASRFDQHVSVEALEFCHSVYLSCFPTSSERDELAKILRMTLDNSGIGYAKDGCIPYSVLGCRMSGDMDTALGNVLLMCCMICALRKVCGLDNKSLRFINDGDDAVLFMEERHVAKVQAAIPHLFSSLGFTMKVEEPVHTLERVEFCQTRPVVVEGEYLMVRNPQTAMAKDLTSILDISKISGFSRWARAVGECGASITGGVPVFQEFYKSLRNTPKWYKGNRNSVLDEMMHGYKAVLYRGMSRKELPVSAETRASFYLAFGIEPDAQILIEKECADWIPDYEEPRLIDQLIDLPDNALITAAC